MHFSLSQTRVHKKSQSEMFVILRETVLESIGRTSISLLRSEHINATSSLRFDGSLMHNNETRESGECCIRCLKSIFIWRNYLCVVACFQ